MILISKIDSFIKENINLSLIKNYSELNINSLIDEDFIEYFMELEEELENLYSDFNFFKIKVSWNGIIFFYKNEKDYKH